MENTKQGFVCYLSKLPEKDHTENMVEEQTRLDKNKGQKKDWEVLAELFHYNERNGMYKKLEVSKTETGNIVIKMSEGQKGQDRNYIVFQLSKQELAYLVLQLQAIYFGMGRG